VTVHIFVGVRKSRGIEVRGQIVPMELSDIWCWLHYASDSAQRSDSVL